MAIDVVSSSVICSRCGKSYGRRKGNFPVSYAVLYKGTGYMTVCKDCIDAMYEKYLTYCGDSKLAVRQMCRKFDLYWNESVYEVVSRKTSPRSMMTSYIAKINTVTYAGKCYDDSLEAEGKLWNFDDADNSDENFNENISTPVDTPNEESDTEIPDEVLEFWGSGFTPSMYKELEQRRRYWTSRLPEGTELDVGTEAIVRQICNLEITINQDRAAGKAIDKNVNALNTLLGSASLKPSQKNQEDNDATLASTPLGVWLYRYETKRPLPEIDEDLKDVNGLRRYIHTWVTGHLAKMLGIKNYYSKMYEDEISRLTVDKPENEEEDEDFLDDILGGDSDEQN